MSLENTVAFSATTREYSWRVTFIVYVQDPQAADAAISC